MRAAGAFAGETRKQERFADAAYLKQIMRMVENGRGVSSLSFHSLRHSFTSALANAGIPEEVRMKLTGHSKRDVHAGYSHHEMELLRSAIAALPKV